MKGEMVRSRMQWLSDGERPSKFFCGLENKNFIDKTMKKIKLANGTHVTDQKEVLHHARKFYSDLFEEKPVNENSDIFSILETLIVRKIDDNSLGSLVSVEELGNVLKKMKSNKTPGIDGITAEFLKVFWGNLKYFIANAINQSYHKGTLSVSLRTCIITCLPKSKKDRTLLKNWRPISLLSVVYKIASGTIANRLKQTLDGLISHSQCGFLPGRQISDVTRLIYDLMHYTESKQLPGLLMLVDFEKAFDSVSWKFLYKTLSLFGFDDNFIKWIKMFNNDIYAHVIQCGFLSEKIQIKRGCRQGDPISAYLFLLCAEVLCLLIKNNPENVGIKIEKKNLN